MIRTRRFRMVAAIIMSLYCSSLIAESVRPAMAAAEHFDNPYSWETALQAEDIQYDAPHYSWDLSDSEPERLPRKYLTLAQARGISLSSDEPLDTGRTEDRIALVIGNGNYANSPLRNPVNDATDMAAALQKLGFQVTLLRNADKADTITAVRLFSQLLALRKGVGLFYYAGHGMQLNGRNYLIPVDANIGREHEVELEAVDVARLLGGMDQAANSMNIVILDACRNNPYARSFRSATQGLAQMDAPTGTWLAYATAPGNVAMDGTGRNGIYTKHLLHQIATPDVNIEGVFKRVRAGVLNESNESQVPWESSSITGDFYFAGGRGVTIAKTTYPIERPYEKPGSELLAGTNNKAPKKPWYKRWYVWGAIALLAVAAGSGGGGGSSSSNSNTADEGTLTISVPLE